MLSFALWVKAVTGLVKSHSSRDAILSCCVGCVTSINCFLPWVGSLTRNKRRFGALHSSEDPFESLIVGKHFTAYHNSENNVYSKLIEHWKIWKMLLHKEHIFSGFQFCCDGNIRAHYSDKIKESERIAHTGEITNLSHKTEGRRLRQRLHSDFIRQGFSTRLRS